MVYIMIPWGIRIYRNKIEERIGEVWVGVIVQQVFHLPVGHYISKKYANHV